MVTTFWGPPLDIIQPPRPWLQKYSRRYLSEAHPLTLSNHQDRGYKNILGDIFLRPTPWHYPTTKTVVTKIFSEISFWGPPLDIIQPPRPWLQKYSRRYLSQAHPLTLSNHQDRGYKNILGDIFLRPTPWHYPTKTVVTKIFSEISFWGPPLDIIQPRPWLQKYSRRYLSEAHPLTLSNQDRGYKNILGDIFLRPTPWHYPSTKTVVTKIFSEISFWGPPLDIIQPPRPWLQKYSRRYLSEAHPLTLSNHQDCGYKNILGDIFLRPTPWHYPTTKTVVTKIFSEISFWGPPLDIIQPPRPWLQKYSRRYLSEAHPLTLSNQDRGYKNILGDIFLRPTPWHYPSTKTVVTKIFSEISFWGPPLDIIQPPRPWLQKYSRRYLSEAHPLTLSNHQDRGYKNILVDIFLRPTPSHYPTTKTVVTKIFSEISFWGPPLDIIQPPKPWLQKYSRIYLSEAHPVVYL